MPEPKTRPTTASVTGFIKRQPDDQTRADCLTLVALMEQVTGEKAVMRGPSIIGFGSYQLVYANGSEAGWPIAAFSPRKKALTIYLMDVFERHPELSARLVAVGGCVNFCMRCLPVSVTKMLPEPSTTTPVGPERCPIGPPLTPHWWA